MHSLKKLSYRSSAVLASHVRKSSRTSTSLVLPKAVKKALEWDPFFELDHFPLGFGLHAPYGALHRAFRYNGICRRLKNENLSVCHFLGLHSNLKVPTFLKVPTEFRGIPFLNQSHLLPL